MLPMTTPTLGILERRAWSICFTPKTSRTHANGTSEPGHAHWCRRDLLGGHLEAVYCLCAERTWSLDHIQPAPRRPDWF